MKRFVFVLGLFFVLSSQNTFAQMAVLDAGVFAATKAAHVDQLLYYAQSIEQMIQSAQNTYNQFQNMLRAEQRAMDNLKGAKDIKSFDDFMEWNNRQLYLEKQAEKNYNNIGIKIGSTNYKLADVDKIPDALKDEYVDYWEKDFSEKQRKEMWTKLGLSPSNYVYVKTWQAREEAIARSILTKPQTQNEANMKANERNNDIMKQLADDQNKPEDQKMGEKEIAQYNLQVAIDTNQAIRELAYDIHEKNELEYAQQQLGAVPANPPRLSESYGKDDFAPITEQQGQFID
jgi:Skp family chaperone for outer membrane proteins